MPGAAPPKVPGGPGAQVFANNGCGGCHTLAAAKSGGVTGPNLDEVLPGQSAAMIEESIVDPNAEIAKGYPGQRDAAELRRDAHRRKKSKTWSSTCSNRHGGKGGAKAAGGGSKSKGG